MVVDQLRCAGVLSAIRMARAAFPNRMLVADFNQRFGPLLGGGPVAAAARSAADPVAATRNLMAKLRPEAREDPAAQFVVGHTKIFFAKGVLEGLEEARVELFERFATRLQTLARGANARRTLRAAAKMQTALVPLQTMVRMVVQRRRFRLQKEGYLSLQARVRGRAARRVAAGKREALRAAAEADAARLADELAAAQKAAEEKRKAREAEEAKKAAEAEAKGMAAAAAAAEAAQRGAAAKAQEEAEAKELQAKQAEVEAAKAKAEEEVRRAGAESCSSQHTSLSAPCRRCRRRRRCCHAHTTTIAN
jgi:myosin heavy subunit